MSKVQEIDGWKLLKVSMILEHTIKSERLLNFVA